MLLSLLLASKHTVHRKFPSTFPYLPKWKHLPSLASTCHCLPLLVTACLYLPLLASACPTCHCLPLLATTCLYLPLPSVTFLRLFPTSSLFAYTLAGSLGILNRLSLSYPIPQAKSLFSSPYYCLNRRFGYI